MGRTKQNNIYMSPNIHTLNTNNYNRIEYLDEIDLFFLFSHCNENFSLSLGLERHLFIYLFFYYHYLLLLFSFEAQVRRIHIGSSHSPTALQTP